MGIFNHKKDVTTTGDPFFEAIRSYSDTTGDMPLSSGYKNSAINAAVKIIAGDLSSNRITSDSKFYETLLNDKPNSNGNGFDLKQALFTNLLLYGNSYALIKRAPANNTVQAIQFVPYGEMRVDVDTETQVINYT